MANVRRFFALILAQASTSAQAALNLGVGVTPAAPNDGDQWNIAAGMMGKSAGVVHPLGPYLGIFSDLITATAGQTTAVLTHTPANKTDIALFLNGWIQDNANVLTLAGKTITFPALTLGDQLYVRYTRLD